MLFESGHDTMPGARLRAAWTTHHRPLASLIPFVTLLQLLLPIRRLKCPTTFARTLWSSGAIRLRRSSSERSVIQLGITIIAATATLVHQTTRAHFIILSQSC